VTQKQKNKRMELLAPAGDLEKLRFAIEYGADAVYFGGEIGSLRAGAGNLSVQEIFEGIEYAHQRGKKAYLAVNIYAHREDLTSLAVFLERIKGAGADAYIVSDPGVISMIKEIIPGASLHLSTQASTTNAPAAKFWKQAGISRIIAAREMSLIEIRNMTDEAEIDVELFAHGAMCVSYSGRCLLSAVMTGREANRGECAHPCRYKYSIMEEKRPGEFFPIEEDDMGTYIMNSKDLCLIRYIPELAGSRAVSIKIEGRMKSLYYVSVVVKAYRQALDAYYSGCWGVNSDFLGKQVLDTYNSDGWDTSSDFSDKQALDTNYSGCLNKNTDFSDKQALDTYSPDGWDTSFDFLGKQARWDKELAGVSHRPYTTGFYLGKSNDITETDTLSTGAGGYISMYDFVGIVKYYDNINGLATVEQRNKISRGDKIEFFGPQTEPFEQKIEEMYDETGDPIESAPHAQQIIKIPMTRPVAENYILRRQKSTVVV
jgi:putative protease